jgi:hypothetical protein
MNRDDVRSVSGIIPEAKRSGIMTLADSESQISEAYNLKVTIGALKFVGRTILGAERRRIMSTLKLIHLRSVRNSS